jgi:hypothetical protein
MEISHFLTPHSSLSTTITEIYREAYLQIGSKGRALPRKRESITITLPIPNPTPKTKKEIK